MTIKKNAHHWLCDYLTIEKNITEIQDRRKPFQRRYGKKNQTAAPLTDKSC